MIVWAILRMIPPFTWLQMPNFAFLPPRRHGRSHGLHELDLAAMGEDFVFPLLSRSEFPWIEDDGAVTQALRAILLTEPGGAHRAAKLWLRAPSLSVRAQQCRDAQLDPPNRGRVDREDEPRVKLELVEVVPR